MSYRAADARQEILDELASAARRLGTAVARLGEAYEAMDEQSAERLEEELFRPAQSAYAVARRTYGSFAERFGITAPALDGSSPGLPAGPQEEVERAAEEIRLADSTIAELQDSMLPVEVGDQELRAGLSRTRELIAPLPVRARELMRVLGR